jgi:hypothetical protein
LSGNLKPEADAKNGHSHRFVSMMIDKVTGEEAAEFLPRYAHLDQ